MRRICSRANIRVAFKPMFTCRQQLVKVKDRRKLLMTWGLFTVQLVHPAPRSTLGRLVVCSRLELMSTRGMSG